MADRVLLKNCVGFHGQIVDLLKKKKVWTFMFCGRNKINLIDSSDRLCLNTRLRHSGFKVV